MTKTEMVVIRSANLDWGNLLFPGLDLKGTEIRSSSCCNGYFFLFVGINFIQAVQFKLLGRWLFWLFDNLWFSLQIWLYFYFLLTFCLFIDFKLWINLYLLWLYSLGELRLVFFCVGKVYSSAGVHGWTGQAWWIVATVTLGAVVSPFFQAILMSK